MRLTPAIATILISLGATVFAQPPRGASARPTGQGPSAEDRPAVGALREGDLAPDFRLLLLDTLRSPEAQAALQRGETHRLTSVTLSSFRGQRPVVLFFGSYT